MTKRYNDQIDVEWAEPGPGLRQPSAFSWRGRRYVVGGLLKYWREAGEWWDPQRARDRECFRVEAEGGVYDLTYDLTFDRLTASGVSGPTGAPGPTGAKAWRLARVWD
ncbi:MAG TPA: DUF6504 family protein [Actinomycetota bacterium]|nr:DUF6504 family protein [Actinomycetota bacterium]